MAAAAQHHERVSDRISLAREKVKFKIEVGFLLNAHCFRTIVKSKNYKQNHCKLGTIYISSELFCCCRWVVGIFYKFWILILYQIYDLQTSPILWLSFHSLLMQKILNFYEVQCIFSFVTCVSYPKKSLPNPMTWSFCPMFSSKSFIVLSLTFRSLIHFELIFVYGVRKEFILSHVGVQFSSTICWKDCPFPTEWSWHPYWKSTDHICKGLFLGSLYLFHWSICLSLCQNHTVLITVALCSEL